jgi:hypothetical protein
MVFGAVKERQRDNRHLSNTNKANFALFLPHPYLSLHFQHFLCFIMSEDAGKSEGKVPTPLTKAFEGFSHSLYTSAKLNQMPEEKQVV